MFPLSGTPLTHILVSGEPEMKCILWKRNRNSETARNMSGLYAVGRSFKGFENVAMLLVDTIKMQPHAKIVSHQVNNQMQIAQ